MPLGYRALLHPQYPKPEVILIRKEPLSYRTAHTIKEANATSLSPGMAEISMDDMMMEEIGLASLQDPGFSSTSLDSLHGRSTTSRPTIGPHFFPGIQRDHAEASRASYNPQGISVMNGQSAPCIHPRELLLSTATNVPQVPKLQVPHHQTYLQSYASCDLGNAQTGSGSNRQTGSHPTESSSSSGRQQPSWIASNQPHNPKRTTQPGVVYATNPSALRQRPFLSPSVPDFQAPASTFKVGRKSASPGSISRAVSDSPASTPVLRRKRKACGEVPPASKRRRISEQDESSADLNATQSGPAIGFNLLPDVRPVILTNVAHERFPADHPVPTTPQKIAKGVGSGSNVMALFGDDPEPRTKYPLKLDRARTGSSAYKNYPSGNTILPARLTLSEIATKYPNHLWGEMLRVYAAEDWTAKRIYYALPEDARATKQESRLWNFLQHGIGREQDHIYFELTGRRRNPTKKTNRSKRPAPPETLEQAKSRFQVARDGVYQSIAADLLERDPVFQFTPARHQDNFVRRTMLQEIQKRIAPLRQIWCIPLTGSGVLDNNLYYAYRQRLERIHAKDKSESMEEFNHAMDIYAWILTADDMEALLAKRESSDVIAGRASGALS